MLKHTKTYSRTSQGELTPFASHILAGLSKPQKSTSAKWLYDARGSDLFEQITELDEYYPTRTEAGILRDNAASIAEHLGSKRLIVEFGSGSSLKTEILLRALDAPTGYVAIDISRAILDLARNRLQNNFPRLAITTSVDDFTRIQALPPRLPDGRRLLFFPGSTIGNFDPIAAQDLLSRFRRLLSPGGDLLIGVDLQKSLDVLLPAYDDARGVTAQFNLNLLARINRELGANFDLSAFAHEARYNSRLARIEMHLVSKRDQTVTVLGHNVRFTRGESIHTENSYKYSVDGVSALAERSGLTTRRTWTDPQHYFGIFLLSSSDRETSEGNARAGR